MFIAIGQFFKGIWDWFWNKASFKLKVVIVACVAGLLFLGWFLILNDRNAKLEKDLQDANFNRQMVNVDIYSNQIKELEKEGNVLQNNTNLSDGDRGNVGRRDSNTFSGNATDKFCQRYPNDSSCAAWRKRNGR